MALARALAPDPRLLMLDEPLGALDRTLREQLSEELRRILRGTRIPAIYVTHDQEEAFALADRVVLLQDGQVVQAGTPAEVYTHPASAWVARFFGLGNIVEGRVAGLRPFTVETSIGLFQPACGEGTAGPGEILSRCCCARPGQGKRRSWLPDRSPGGQPGARRRRGCVFRGDAFRVTLREPGGTD